MNEDNQTQEYNTKQIIDKLSKMSPMIIATAYLQAVNLVEYGEDVTQEWVTAVQNTSALEKAYQKGYYDALQRQVHNGATNGDIIKAMFPDAEFDNAKPFTDGRWETMNLDTENRTRATYKPTQLRTYADWWNAPYNTGSEVDK